VSGNGQRELAECLSGLRKVTSGKIELDNKEITGIPLKERVDSGLSYIPEERMRDGAIREFSVQENLFLQDHASPQFTRGIFLDFPRMEIFAKKMIKEFTVKTPHLDTPVKNLSGGNIQKLIMARELARQPKVLIAAQPTRGVDIGATEYIHERLLMQRDAGTAILLISEDLDEIRTLSDRIAIIYEGSIIGIVDRDGASVEQIGLMMAGISMEEAIHRSV
jgi:simple sugar transport system ATP-binding protein